MAVSLRVLTFIVIIIYFFLIFRLLKGGKFALKYSLIWLFAGLVMLVIVVFPEILNWCAHLIGIEVASNGLFATCILFEIIILVSLTAAISSFENRVKVLVQKVALMEERVRILEEKLKNEHE